MEWLLRAGPDKALLTTARTLASSALAAQPDSHYGHQELGMTAFCQGQYQRAFEHLTLARDLRPLDCQILVDFAYALIANGHAREALSLVNKAGGATDYRWGGFRNWVIACGHYSLGEYEAAISALVELRMPSQVNRLIAACYAMLGECEKAEEAKNKYLEKDPNFSIDGWLSQSHVRADHDLRQLRDGFLLAGFH
jgi:Flp pilus assembly protein TadD